MTVFNSDSFSMLLKVDCTNIKKYTMEIRYIFLHFFHFTWNVLLLLNFSGWFFDIMDIGKTDSLILASRKVKMPYR